MVHDAGSRVRPGHGIRQVALPLLFCLIYLAQCAWFIQTQSLTDDEPLHIMAGLDAWRHGKFEIANDHPPLARLLCTLPLLLGKWEIEGGVWSVNAIRPSAEGLAWHTRPVNALLGLALGLWLWMTARLLFSKGTANLVLALFALSPALIAHFSLVTTDGAGALLAFGLAAQTVRWRRDPSWFQSGLLGLVMAGGLLAKLYTLPLVALALGLVLLMRPNGWSLNPRHWNWGKASAMLALALLLLWGGYFFHLTKVSVPVPSILSGRSSLGFPKGANGLKSSPPTVSFVVPAGEYLEGYQRMTEHSRWGHRSYFLGEVSETGGWPLYFPVTILLKWPMVVLSFAAATLLLFVLRRLPFTADLLVLTAFPVLFMLLVLFSNINIGDRHILPLCPFLLLFAGAIWEFARGRRTLVVLVGCAVFLQVIDNCRYAPDYLSYFNVFVPPSQSYKLLTDSNLDWGQGLIALREYENKHPQEKIHLAYFGPVKPSVYGVRALPLAETERVSGTVIVSATYLSGQGLKNPSSYRWVLRYPRQAILNHSLHVFDVPEPARY